MERGERYLYSGDQKMKNLACYTLLVIAMGLALIAGSFHWLTAVSVGAGERLCHTVESWKSKDWGLLL